jgi:hypothetical protein
MSAEICRVDARRHRLSGSREWNGIEAIEVAASQRTLSVYFFGAAPKNLAPANIRIDGGRRITGIKATGVAAAPSDDDTGGRCLRVTLDRYGDFSTYTLRLVETMRDEDGAAHERTLAGFDPRYDRLDFSFKSDCPNELDCAAPRDCPTDALPAPDINYLAKDYASLRQLMFDRLAVTMPDWRERHVPDIGVTLIELFAYVGDQLSYYQDAVATEAYLDTARTRISVRRHARLVDYRLHEGCNARAWLSIGCSADATLKRDTFYFITRDNALAAAAHGQVLREADLEGVPTGRYEVFEPACPSDADIDIRALCSTLRFHTWGDEACCLPKGATSATLIDPSRTVDVVATDAAPKQPSPPAAAAKASATTTAAASSGNASTTDTDASSTAPLPPLLAPGDVLIFEEVLGPTTGNSADADPAHRCAVRLTKVDATTDALLGVAVLDIEWSPADALPFALCLSARLPAPDCRCVHDVSVVRGNVILVDHGRRFCEEIGVVGSADGEGGCGCENVVRDTIVGAAAFAPVLGATPLASREPPSCDGPASTALAQDPRRALAQLAMCEAPVESATTRTPWRVVPDLLASGADDRDVVVEVDDEGFAHLRFGDGRLGRRPDAGSYFSACYRVGGGTAGNVPADAIAYIVFRDDYIEGADIAPRNPMPARGGIAPETIDEAKRAAPHAFRKTVLRAITAADYASLAGEDARLQRANASLAWTGSWYEADVAIDPLGAEGAPQALCRGIEKKLRAFRRVGHDLEVMPARYVPLAVTLQICVLEDYLRSHVVAAVADALGSRRLADGSLGFFHPDRLTFGGHVYASDLVAAAQAVEGVQSVQLIELRRLGAPSDDTPPGDLALAVFEIAQLDGDPDFPEHGQLTLCTGGGR